MSQLGRDYVLFWAFGVALGVVLQRSRFCFASAFRDLFLFGGSSTLKGILAGMAVASTGFALLESKMVSMPGLPGVLPPEAHLFPLGWHLVVGGVLFGIGMTVAGGCVSGTLYRMGEGYAASYAAFAGIVVGLGLAAHSWGFWWEHFIGPGPVVWLPRYLGYAGALALTLAGIGAVWLLLEVREARLPAAAFVTAGQAGGAPWSPADPASVPAAGPGAGGIATPRPSAVRRRLAALARPILRDGWPALTGGVLLGLLNVYLYVAHMPWGVTGEISRWAVELSTLLGWPPGPLPGAGQLPGCTLTLGGSRLVSHSLMLDLGMVAGSFTAALASGEWRWRMPRQPRRFVQSAAGGILMGYGAALAGGAPSAPSSRPSRPSASTGGSSGPPCWPAPASGAGWCGGSRET
ncbi:MAG: YeeE/YedE family protein [Limnochordaceae bacterium]|nr:YeeE/YedE family protein [Limnochordaceae bacterium]